jgi:hypothetical protein
MDDIWGLVILVLAVIGFFTTVRFVWRLPARIRGRRKRRLVQELVDAIQAEDDLSQTYLNERGLCGMSRDGTVVDTEALHQELKKILDGGP